MVQTTDFISEWNLIHIDRLAMYRSLETQTVTRLGREHFVDLYKSGVL